MESIKFKRKIFSDSEKEQILEKTNRRCAHCGCRLDIREMTIEHMYPIDKGGDNSEFNIVAMCERCNKQKSNFVYETAFYKFIKKEYLGLYNITLLHNIYKNSKSTDIFGQCTRVISFVSPKIYAMLSGKRMNKAAEQRTIAIAAKQFEMRVMYPGDIDDEALELIARSYKKINETSKVVTSLNKEDVNKYTLLNLFQTSTFYGVYKGNKLESIHCLTNIKNLKLSNDKFVENIEGDYNEIYVEIIDSASHAVADSLDMVLVDIMMEYMAFTGNLILRNFMGLRVYMSAAMNGYNATSAFLPQNMEILTVDSEYTGLTLVAGGNYYDSMLDGVRRKREILDKQEQSLKEYKEAEKLEREKAIEKQVKIRESVKEDIEEEDKKADKIMRDTVDSMEYKLVNGMPISRKKPSSSKKATSTTNRKSTNKSRKKLKAKHK